MLGLITDSVIEDFLVVLEQAFNPSKVVVAVSGGGEARVHLKRPAAVVNHAVVSEPGHQVLLDGSCCPYSCSDLNLRRPKW